MSFDSFTRRIFPLTACAILAGLTAQCSICVWNAAISWSQSTTTGDFTVTLNQRGEQRQLTVSTDNSEIASVELMSEWGPKLRANLYRIDRDTIAVLDFSDSLSFSRKSPLLGVAVEPSKAWIYLGTFLWDDYQVKFFPAGTLSECMDILMDEPPPDNERKEIYRGECNGPTRRLE